MSSEAKNTPIYVTKSFLPPRQEFDKLVDEIWQSGQLTNNGPLLQQLEEKLRGYLEAKNLQFVTNGTLALQVALEALDINEGEIITTPFSYVATVSSILWQHCEPVFVDIDELTLNIDPNKIEAAITSRTRAILPVHVFGNPCDVLAIESIAKKRNLKVLYDAAHAFGVRYQNRSLLSYGDASTLSFHATKSFHTIEGGAIVVNDDKLNQRIDLVKRFGHVADDHFTLGINAKASDFQAAMGLVNLKYYEKNTQKRRAITELYDNLLNENGSIHKQRRAVEATSNYTYYPVIFENEDQLRGVEERLAKKDIFPRRYFYPSLNLLPYMNRQFSCPISESVSKRILCLPLYSDLNESNVVEICTEVNR